MRPALPLKICNDMTDVTNMRNCQRHSISVMCFQSEVPTASPGGIRESQVGAMEYINWGGGTVTDLRHTGNYDTSIAAFIQGTERHAVCVLQFDSFCLFLPPSQFILLPLSLPKEQFVT